MSVAKRMPENALVPRRDPLLDESRVRRAWRAISTWALAIALVLGFAFIDGWLDRMDQEAQLRMYREDRERGAREIDRLQHQLAIRTATGGCSTLFYLVESEDMVGAGNKLLAASMQLATVTNQVLYPTPTPQLVEAR